MTVKTFLFYVLVAIGGGIVGASLMGSLGANRMCVPPIATSKEGDCSQSDPGIAVVTCYAPDGPVFMRWRDGRWLEVVPK